MAKTSNRCWWRAPEPLPAPAEDSGGGEQLDAFVDAELAEERARRDRFNARGNALITTSAGLGTLMFSAASLVTGQDKYVPPRGTVWFLGLAFVAFAVAAVCGLRASRSVTVEVVGSEQLLEWRGDDENIWNNSRDNVRWLLTKAKIDHLASLRMAVTKRAAWAVRGSAAQLAALVGLVGAVGLVFMHETWPNWEGVLGILTPF